MRGAFVQQRRASTVLAALLAASLYGNAALAGSLRIDPVRVALTRAQPTATLVIENRSAEPTLIHAQLMRWTQAENQDHYAPSRELLLTPAVFELAPGARQVVRVGVRAPHADAGIERAYRLYVQEVPRAQTAHTGTQVLLRIGVPVFVGGAPAPARLSWHVEDDALVARNHGQRHARLTALRLLGDDSTPLTELRELVYLLPGSSQRFALDAAAAARLAAGQPIAVQASGDVDDALAHVVPAAPRR